MGRALATIAPIAAGAMFPGFGTTALGGMFGSGVAAGALTGAGIAALTGDDPLLGAVGGGLGGYGGGGLRGAMDATALNATTPTVTPSSFAGSPALASNIPTASTFPGAGQFTGQGLNVTSGGGYNPTTGIGGGIGAPPTLSQGFQASVNDPGAFVNNLGGGSTAAGYGKLAMTAAPPLLELTAPEYETYDETEDMYDPNKQLNLNMDTGIKAALEKDSGLRLYAGGGRVSPGDSTGGVSSAMMDALNNLQMQMSSSTPIPAPPPGSIVGEKESKERMEKLLREKRLRRGYAEGGDVGGGVTGAGLASGTPVAGAGAVSETMSGSGGTETFSSMVASGIHPANAAAMLGMDTAPYLDTGPGMEFTGTPSTSPVRSGIGTLPPPPTPFTPDAGFDYETYSGGYMAPSGMKTLVGIGAGGYPSPVSPGITKSRFEEMIRKGYATGGYLNGGTLKGDGMSDDVPAMIDGTQKAALSQGEFVVPADVVSHLGNGSSDAGSKQLYGMMDKIRKARTGTKKQGKQINPERFMPN